MQTILRKASYALVALIGLLILIVIVSTLPIEGNYTFKIVDAGSMEPTISRGSLLMIVPQKTYERGDVITWRSGTVSDKPVYTTHRIEDVQVIEGEYQYITKGDANLFRDMEPVAGEKVRGKVIIHIPYIQNIASFIKTPAGFFILIIIPAFAIFFEEWRRREDLKKTA